MRCWERKWLVVVSMGWDEREKDAVDDECLGSSMAKDQNLYGRTVNLSPHPPPPCVSAGQRLSICGDNFASVPSRQ